MLTVSGPTPYDSSASGHQARCVPASPRLLQAKTAPAVIRHLSRQEERPKSACTQLQSPQSPQSAASEPKEGSRYTRVWQLQGKASCCTCAISLPRPRSAPWGCPVLALPPGQAWLLALVIAFLLPLSVCPGFSAPVEVVWPPQTETHSLWCLFWSILHLDPSLQHSVLFPLCWKEQL